MTTPDEADEADEADDDEEVELDVVDEAEEADDDAAAGRAVGNFQPFAFSASVRSQG